MAKLILGACVAILVAVLGGWLWGASGRWELDRALQASELRGELLAARSSVLGARVDLYDLNFGDASRNLEDAQGSLRRATEHLRNLDRDDEVARLEPALTRVQSAQELAGRLDQAANRVAAEALQPIDDLLKTARP